MNHREGLFRDDRKKKYYKLNITKFMSGPTGGRQNSLQTWLADEMNSGLPRNNSS